MILPFMKRSAGALRRALTPSGGDSARERLTSIPALQRPALYRIVRAIKLLRRTAAERLGVDRFSQPSLGHLEPTLAAYLPNSGGVFVEAGAYDGYWQSNTYWLERFRGWTGVLIEPMPDLAASARRTRPQSQVFQCALVAADSSIDALPMLYAGTMSMVRGVWGSPESERERATYGASLAQATPREIVVPARTLSAVLDEARVTSIDFMSLDVEGYEIEVLRGLDLDRHAPGILLVEMLDEERNRPAIEQVLGSRYALDAKISDLDYVYRRL
jgi:FkbM family methyltransferase